MESPNAKIVNDKDVNGKDISAKIVNDKDVNGKDISAKIVNDENTKSLDIIPSPFVSIVIGIGTFFFFLYIALYQTSYENINNISYSQIIAVTFLISFVLSISFYKLQFIIYNPHRIGDYMFSKKRYSIM